MNDCSDNVLGVSRIYERLLWVYPRSHRREFGPLMAQLFRDQCRAAIRADGRRALLAPVLRAVPDLIVSAFREHLTEQDKRMKNMSPQKASLILFVTATSAAILSCTILPGQRDVALGLAYLASVILLVRAFVQWKRPESELIMSLSSGATIAVVFAIVLPWWAKESLPIIPSLVLTPMFLNAIIPLIKTGRRLIRQRS